MLLDAKSSQFDIIVTKSISRFARNTVDLLKTIRELKAMNIEVIFQAHHISSMDERGEMLLSILGSIAQEESRNISENIKWSIKHNLEKGKFTLPYKRFLGYKQGKTGRPEIIKKEARIVQRIYYLFINDVPISRICAILEKKQILSPSGKAKWHFSTVKSILTNEKYKGDAILQKTYVKDFLDHKSIKNNGEIKRYYIKNSHPAIIDEATWEKAQKKLTQNYKHN